MREKIWNNLDVLLGTAGAIIGIITLVLGLKINNVMIQQVSIVLLSGTIVYFLCRHTLKDENKVTICLPNPRQKYIYSTIIIQILYAYAIYLCYIEEYSRPLLFLIIASIISGFLAISIFTTTSNLQSTFVLCEILALGILLRATAYFQFPTMIGGDPCAHASWIYSLSDIGNIAASMAPYKSFPLMHIFVTIIYDITNLTIKDSMAFVGFCEVISLIFLYMIGRKAFNQKIGLTIVLLTSLSASNILYGYLIIPQTFGIVLTSMLLFFLFSQSETNNNKKLYTIFTIIVLITILFAHSIVSFVVLVMLFSILAIWLIVGILSSKKLEWSNFYFFAIILTIFSILTIEYWSIESGFSGFIADSIHWGFSSSDLAPAASSLTLMKTDFVYSLVKEFPMYLSIFFAIIGSLGILKLKKSLPFFLFGWGVVVFIFISTFLGLNNFLPGRWLVFVNIALCIPLALSFIFLTNTVSRKAIFIFILFTIVAIIMTTNYEANVTNVNPFTPYPTQASKESELIAVNTLSSIIPPELNLYGDVYSKGSKNNNRPVLDGSLIYIQNQDFSGVLLVRKEIMNNVFFAHSDENSGHLSTSQINPSFAKSIQGEFKIYDCGTVQAIEKVKI